MKKIFLILSIFLATNFAFAYVDCRDNINGCTLEAALQLCQNSPNGYLDQVNACKYTITKIQERIEYLANSKPMNDGGTCQKITNKLWIGKSDANTNGDVTRLQKFFKKIGIVDWDADGKFGTWDRAAVWKFQQNYMPNMSPTGDVGNLTMAKINEMLCSVDNYTESIFTGTYGWDSAGMTGFPDTFTPYGEVGSFEFINQSSARMQVFGTTKLPYSGGDSCSINKENVKLKALIISNSTLKPKIIIKEVLDTGKLSQPKCPSM